MSDEKKIGLWVLIVILTWPTVATAQWPGDLVWNVPIDNVGTSVPSLLSMRVAVGEQRRFRARLTYGGQIIDNSEFDLYQFMAKDVNGYTVSTVTMTPESPTTGGWVACTFTSASLPSNAYYGAIVATNTTASLKLIAGWWKISLTGLLPTTALGAGTHDEVIVTTLTATNIRTQTLWATDLNNTSFPLYVKRDGTQGPTAAWDFNGYNLTNVGNLLVTGGVGIGDSTPQSILTVGSGDKFTVNAGGQTSTAATATYFNKSGPDADQSIYFYDGGSPTGARLWWNDTPGRFSMNGGGLQVNGLGTTDGWGTTVTAGAAGKAIKGLVVSTSATTGKTDYVLDLSGSTGLSSADRYIYAKSNAYLTGDGDWVGRNINGIEGASAGTYYPFSGNFKTALWDASKYTIYGRPTVGNAVVTTGSAVGEWSMQRLSTRSEFVSSTSYTIRASVERRSQTYLTTGTSTVDFVMPDMATLWSRNHETTGTICAEFTISNQSSNSNRIEAGASATFRMAGTNYHELVLNAGATVTLMQAPRPSWQWIIKSRDGTVTGI